MFWSDAQMLSNNWVVLYVEDTDLINRTGSSIYCWETEANGVCDATEISNMAAGGHSSMVAVGNNKMILWSQKYS